MKITSSDRRDWSVVAEDNRMKGVLNIYLFLFY